MKKRSRLHRQRRAPHRKALEVFARRSERKQRTWMFEHLEERHYMSATPIDLQFQSLSSATAEGAAAIQARELAWAMMASANTSSGASGVGSGAALENSPYLPALYSLNDPYLQYQWHLQNVGQEVGNPDYQKIFGLPGQDINVTPVWNQGITGEGVLVAVIDNGVQTNHPDLAANIHPSLSFGNSPGDHGTAVAGLIAAVGNNDKGGTGVAPDAQIVPIRIAFDENFEQSVLDSFQYAITNGVAVTNNSYGFAAGRSAISLSPELLNMLRSSVLFGRDGLGMINVFASGNSAGPAFVEGFPDIGSNDSAAYNAFANSRYTIAVTGVDHDGQYINADGTFTDYMEAGPSVLVAAPTGSYATAVADDAGTGSGIFTTDLTGNNGYNVAPLPSGFEIDTDYFDDPDYTSRFNGTSASAPIVSGVIALMLQANPQLNWRDVQEILVRSARQNAQFERAASGGIQTRNPTTWQTNQSPIFQEPDPFNPAKPPEPGTAGKLVYTPTLDGGFGQSETSEPALFMNGAGYTVSQGYGVYTELIGYGHGVVDADLAVKMAQQWHQKGQNLGEELTFTTFVNQVLLSLPAAERGNDDSGNILVPGGLGGESGFIEYWNEYFVEDDPEDPEDGPFSGDDPPDNTRGFSFIEFNVPEDQNMAVESVDVKVSISGPSEDLDHVRLLLVSPDGTHSELNHFYVDPENDNSSMQAIDINFRDWLSPPLTQFFDPGASIDPDGGSFVWTFNTNRSWGERSDDAFIIDPISREPVTSFGSPVSRGWRLYVENWSNSAFGFDAVEIAWHGHAIGADTQRVRGFVGEDQNNDGVFNYDRFTTSAVDNDQDGEVTRLHEVVSNMDLSQEKYIANATVSAYPVNNGVVQSTAAARFITGHDGNYYFDLVPGEYVISVDNPELQARLKTDTLTPAGFLSSYRQSWHITPAWFSSFDREDVPPITPQTPYVPPLVLADASGNPMTLGFTSGVSGLNFLLTPENPPSNSTGFSGSVYADIDGNGKLDGNDTGAGGVVVYVDANRDGARQFEEVFAVTSTADADRGKYLLDIPATQIGTTQVRIEKPSSGWTFTNPSDGKIDAIIGPGTSFSGKDFFIKPPANTPGGAGSEPGSLLGVVFNDRDGDSVRDPGDEGLAGWRVFVDSPQNGEYNGVYDVGELSAVTDSRGAYMIANVPVGTARLDMETEETWDKTTPALGYHEVMLASDGTFSNLLFGLNFLADRDFGDLPDSYSTLDASGGPWHAVVPGFQMGTLIDGEVNGKPSTSATGDDLAGVNDDDGVVITSNGGVLDFGENTLQVTLNGIGGLLNGWMDFNHDGDFNDNGEQIFTNLDRNPGTYSLTVQVPEGAKLNYRVATRFRWGAPNLGIGGGTFVGEVEDYAFGTVTLLADYNSDSLIDDLDRAVYWATFGSTTDLRADGNRNGVIDSADYVFWRTKASSSTGGSAASLPGSGSGAVLATLSSEMPAAVGPSDSSSPTVVSASIPTETVAASTSVALPVYLPVFWNSPQAIGVVSTIEPDQDAGGAVSDPNLLMDQAWSTWDSSSGSNDLAVRTAHEYSDDVSAANDLALASVFDDELDWQSGI